MSEFDKKSAGILAELVGIKEIESEACENLVLDAEYRLREIIDTAVKFMRRGHRDILTSEDIKRAMRLFEMDSVYGYPCSYIPKYKKVPKTEDLWYLKDKEISLNEYIRDAYLSPPLDVSLHTHWLAIRGRRPNIPENHAESADETEDETPQALEASVNIVSGVTHSLSYEQQIYYNALLDTLETGSRVTECLKNLAEDSSLTQLLPYITKTLYSVVLESNCYEKLERGIEMAGALFLNRFINLEPYLHQLLPTVLSCLLRVNLETENHWRLRDKAALILAASVNKYSTDYEDVKVKVLKLLLSTMFDETKPLMSHYGAIQGIAKFGPESIKALLLPNYSEYISKFVSQKTDSTSGMSQCYSALIDSAKELLRSYPNYYSELVEIFGSRLTELT